MKLTKLERIFRILDMVNDIAKWYTTDPTHTHTHLHIYNINPTCCTPSLLTRSIGVSVNVNTM